MIKKSKVTKAIINNEEKHNINKVTKVYLVTTRTRANLEKIISKVILLVVENKLLPIILVIDTNKRPTTINNYRYTYIDTKDTIVFIALKIKDYYNTYFIP